MVSIDADAAAISGDRIELFGLGEPSAIRPTRRPAAEAEAD